MITAQETTEKISDTIPFSTWTGIITMEDFLEELVGKIGDEFDAARSGQIVSLADAMSENRVVFNLHADSMPEAIQQIIERLISLPVAG